MIIARSTDLITVMRVIENDSRNVSHSGTSEVGKRIGNYPNRTFATDQIDRSYVSAVQYKPAQNREKITIRCHVIQDDDSNGLVQD